MAIEIKSKHGGELFDSIEEFVSKKLDGEDQDNGSLEDLEDSCKNNREAIGRLLAVLKRKNVLSLEDIYAVARGFYPAEIDETISEFK